jgi:5-methylcytosine-specific restriction protein A
MLPVNLTHADLEKAIRDIDAKVSHPFANSTKYDVLFGGRRYPPKAIVGVAASNVTGDSYGPYDFKGGLKSLCFRILQDSGFEIVGKSSFVPLPEEIDEEETHVEGAATTVLVNRYERDSKARAKCIKHHGCKCQICGFDFEAVYGPIGEGYIHVHHVVLISSIGEAYVVDPVNDLKPVCPNCHAMLHRRTPPYSIEELGIILSGS